jgi:hypothetical protein
MLPEVQNIINNNGLNKTEKMKALFALGRTRREVADWVANGNYGFAQNVFKVWQAGRSSVTPTRLVLAPAFTPTAFDRKFGVEIESFGISKETLVRALRLTGLSCEVEGYNHTTRNHWKIVNDSSIGGEDAFELVSPILEGQDGLEQVKKVSNVLVSLRAKVNKTCGLHIHFDAANLNLQNWKNLILNYANLEGVIDSMMPASRRANTYCQTMKIDDLATKMNDAQTIDAAVNIFTNRYRKINTQAYFRQKTVEFRQHSGTIESEKIINWILFLHNLVSYSAMNLETISTFDALKKFNQEEIVDFYHNRIQDLNS